MGYEIYDKTGAVRLIVHEFEYSDTDMGVCQITMTINSPTPIPFSNGDYIIYRNEKFTLNYVPTVKKQARSGEYGEAFVYDNLVFNSIRDELTRIMFYDVVSKDNNIPYTNLPTFSFTDTNLLQFSSRIQANLDRVLGEDVWKVEIHPNATQNDGTPIKDYNYSFSNQTVWDALVQMSNSQNVSFVVKNEYMVGDEVVNSKKIILGATHDVTGPMLKYGKGNGFKSIESQSSESEQVITRLHAYGNSTNLPYRYYNHVKNGVYSKTSTWPTEHPLASLYMPNLCLPKFATAVLNPDEIKNYNDALDVVTDGGFKAIVKFYNEEYKEVSSKQQASFAFIQRVDKKGDLYHISDVYIQSIRNYGKYGIKEGVINFDTEDTENGIIDIYPSIQWSNNKIMRIDDTSDLGLPNEDGTIEKAMFSVFISDVGFNVRDNQYGADATPQLLMTSGMCTGRTFDIATCSKVGNQYKLECVRSKDDSIDRYFPYKDFHIYPGDTFAFLNIQMPDSYVTTASEKLLSESLKYLSLHDSNTITINPELDNIYLASDNSANPLRDIIRAGLRLNIQDDDIVANTKIDGLIISTLKINVGKSLIDEYEITLASDKEADLISRVVGEVKSYFATGGLINTKIMTDMIKQTGKDLFISKNADDTAKGIISFDKGIQSSSFISGLLGSGFMLKNIGDSSILEVDRLNVRKKATFNELDIKKVSHSGGEIILSSASCKLAKVVGIREFYTADPLSLVTSDSKQVVVDDVNPTAWICYFRAKDGEDIIYNTWKVGDLARCQTFNLEQGQKYYWRKVVGVSPQPENDMHYIVLLKDECDTDSGIPASGDEVVQLGCVDSNETSRQNAIVMSANGDIAPSFTQLKGIKSYSIGEANVVTQLSPEKNIIRGHEISMIASDGKVASILDIQKENIEQVIGSYTYPIDLSNVDKNRYSGVSIMEGALVVNDTNSEEYGLLINLGKIEDNDKVVVTYNNSEEGSIFARLLVHNGDSSNAQDVLHDAGVITDGEPIGMLLGQSYVEMNESSTSVISDAKGDAFILLLEDGYPNLRLESISIVKAVLSEGSSIKQTKDDITFAVGQTGINIQDKTITLNAETTKIRSTDGTETMFQGGKIKANFIQASELEVGKLKTRYASQNKAHIEAQENYLAMYTDDGTEKCRIHGGNLGGDENLFYADIAHTPVRFNWDGGYSQAESQTIELCSIDTPVTELRVRGFNIYFKNAKQDEYRIETRIYLKRTIGVNMNDVELDSQAEYHVVGNYTMVYSGTPSVKFEQPTSGLKLCMDVTLKVNQAPANVNQQIVMTMDNTIVSTATANGTEIANNGFRVKMSDNNVVKQMECSSERILMRFGGYGLRIDDSGIKYTTDGSNWTKLVN